MILKLLPLTRQIDLVFKEVGEELANLSSGIVFVQICNNQMGKFGVRYDSILNQDGGVERNSEGLSEIQRWAFRKLGIQSLKRKKNWTCGEILFYFALKHGSLHTSVQFQSNYSMANLMSRRE
ncbi:MAG TPA: O-methyltransferase [Bacilli bacterium]